MLMRSLTTALTVLVSSSAMGAAQTRGGNAQAPAIRACAVLPAAEVQRLSGLPDPLNLFQKLPPEEEPVGRGSSCNYPTVHVQIDPFGWSTIDAERGKAPAQFEAISGIGEAAYLRANKPAATLEFAELYARIGTHVLTIQLDVPNGKTTAAVKPGLVALAQAYAAKLR